MKIINCMTSNKRSIASLFSSKSATTLAIAGSLCLLNACAVTPTSIINKPTTARPSAPTPIALNSGGIYNIGTFRPMLEDRRARFVGDTITINIVENTSATKAGGSSQTKAGSVDTSIGAFMNRSIPSATFNGSNALSNKDTAAANSSNVFTGSITTTVIEVLPNGYLVVSGEKQVSLDKGTEFVRLSGVVNPDVVALGNTIPSTQVANAKVEYRTNSKIDGALVASSIARFFLSLAAF
ncbi:MAG TPA: flagellar basal body L-ring protein FlgH [Methyloradius sp.]